MKKLLLLFAFVVISLGYAFYRYLPPKSRTISTYIDGTWNLGAYRGCILIPPDRQQLYCGVQAKGPWKQVLSDKDHIRIANVSFRGKPDVVFWRCQMTIRDIQCKDAGIKTELR